jgi:hypothetical protein
MKTRIIWSCVSLIFGLATAADAMVMPAPCATVDSGVIKIAEGCGPGW